ncbi:MAG: hypothetical protein DRJ59_06125 [Thermoprotei archaeon]|mgnify:CR=1 FL=1|nr:MAG: hypothetical protein DRJ59_06125 [Thermoprotei archaeon]
MKSSTATKLNGLLGLSLFFIVLTAILSTGINFAKAEEKFMVIYIKPDGSITPSTAPIIRKGGTYLLTQDVFGRIIVQKSNIVLDGANHKLYGGGHRYMGLILDQVHNVVVRNIEVCEFRVGIYFNRTFGCLIYGARIIGPSLVNLWYGILLESSANNTICHTILRHYGYGIYLRNSSNNVIKNNELAILDEYGLKLELNSNSNNITGNRITRVHIGICSYNSSGNLIALNNITTTRYGIAVTFFSETIITENNVTNNYIGINVFASNGTLLRNNIAFNKIGVHLTCKRGYSIVGATLNITLKLNSFINNTVNVRLEGVNDCSLISFNKNYWSDYSGVDKDGDGLGDSPYVVTERLRDPSPLIKPVIPPPPRPSIAFYESVIKKLMREDPDNDGIRSRAENQYIKWLDPYKKNDLIPCVTKYLKRNGLDENERVLLDFLVKMERDLIPPEVKEVYYANGFVVANYSYRLFAWAFIRPNEIKWYQLLLVVSVLKDGKVSSLEAKAIKFLNNYLKQGRWSLILDIIASGMISEEYLFLDFDCDGVLNFKELAIGSNPLNDLETDPSNLSERYALIIPPLKCGGPACPYMELELYHLLKKHGYDDAHIFLVFPDISTCYEFYMVSFLHGSDLLVDFGKIEIDFPLVRVYPEYCCPEGISLTKVLEEYHPWDGNDEIIIFERGHGLPCSPEDSDWIYKLLNKWKPYGRLVWFRSTCYAGSFFEAYFKKEYPENFIGVASSSPRESGGFGHLFTVLYYDFPNIVPRIIEWARNPFEAFLGKDIDAFISLKDMRAIDRMYFYYDEAKVDWLDRWNFIHYIPYVKGTPLKLRIYLLGERGENGWFTSSVTIVLKSEPKSKAIAYSFDNKTWRKYTGPIRLSQEGCFTIYYGFEETIEVGGFLVSTIKIDMSPPIVRILSPANNSCVNSDLIEVRWRGYDKVSGIKYYELFIDGKLIYKGNGTSFKVPVSSLSVGKHVIVVRATDVANNIAETKVTIRVGVPWDRIIAVSTIIVVVLVILVVYYFRRKWHE